MKRFTWVTDPHLNFVSPEGVESFGRTLADTKPDAVFLGGDIGEANSFTYFLDALERHVDRPVYFVLGNHDFYRGSISGVRARAESLRAFSSHLLWLPRAGIVPLTADTALVGHDGWGDARLGNYAASNVLLNDYFMIQELNGLDKEQHRRRIQALGDEAAQHFRSLLPEALAKFRRVIVLTHVPPFRAASWHRGQISDDSWLPFFSCKAVGDVLFEAMTANPNKEMTVLCGHTHSPGEVDILPNLHVLTGGTEYGKPMIQKVFEIT